MDKPFLTFEQQIEKLKNDYNLIINDCNFAIEALSSLSYYDLINGYQSIYMIDGKYIDGITIEQLYSTHIFNKNIQGVLLKYATYAENSFKTLLSHVIAKNFSEHQGKYLEIKNYKKSNIPDDKEKLKKILRKMVDTCETCIDTPTKHYRLNRNHIPPWILFRNVSFSNTADLLKFLKTKEKGEFFALIPILNTNLLNFEDKVNISLSSLRIIRKFRNKAAHNLDFLTHRETYLNKKSNLLFISNLVSEKEVNITRNDIWGMVIATVIFLNNKYIIQNFLAELNSYMNIHSNSELIEIYCKVTGIPLDYEKRINKYLDTIEF